MGLVHFLLAACLSLVCGQDSFSLLDSSPPIGLFTVVMGGDTCTLVFTTDNVFVFNNSLLLSQTGSSNLLSTTGFAVQAAAVFAQKQGKGVVAAIADSGGAINFATMNDCNSPFVVVKEWLISPIQPGLNITTAIRVTPEKILFSGMGGKALFVGWIQGAKGLQLGLTQVVALQTSQPIRCGGRNADESLFVLSSGPKTEPMFDSTAPLLFTQAKNGSFFVSGRIIESGLKGCPVSTYPNSSYSVRTCGSFSVQGRYIGALFSVDGDWKPFVLGSFGATTLSLSFNYGPHPNANVYSSITAFVPTQQSFPDHQVSMNVILVSEATDKSYTQAGAWLLTLAYADISGVAQPIWKVTSSRFLSLGGNTGFNVDNPVLVENLPGHQFVYSVLTNGESSALLALDVSVTTGETDLSYIYGHVGFCSKSNCDLVRGLNSCSFCQNCQSINLNVNGSNPIMYTCTSCD